MDDSAKRGRNGVDSIVKELNCEAVETGIWWSVGDFHDIPIDAVFLKSRKGVADTGEFLVIILVFSVALLQDEIIVAGWIARIRSSILGLRPYLNKFFDETTDDLQLKFRFGDEGAEGFICFDKRRGLKAALIPDLYLLSAAAIRNYYSCYAFSDFLKRFKARVPKAFWRGSTTGLSLRRGDGFDEFKHNPRVVACCSIRDILGERGDAKITNIVQYKSNIIDELRDYLSINRIFSCAVKEEEFGLYQMYIDLPGNACAWGTYRKYLMGCLVLRPQHEFELFYYKLFEPWVHYIPVSSNFDNLHETVEWVLSNPEHAARIAYSGRMQMIEVITNLELHLRTVLQSAASYLPAREALDEQIPRWIVSGCEKAVNGPRIISQGEPKSELSLRVHESLQAALMNTSSLPRDLLDLPGMSGKKYRLFVNNVVKYCRLPNYLEIGSWSGSSLCAAIYKNAVRAFAIDNWSQFGGPLNTFFTNLGKYASSTNNVSFLNSDFRQVDYSAIGKFNIYFFDGPNEEQDHYDGLALARQALENECVFIVDDWNWKQVREGTLRAIADIGAKIEYAVEIFSTEGDVHPGNLGLPTDQNSDWHNGYLLSVLSFK
jgi:hypothetical protein